jgi:uncharacterized protein YjiS (DUF1127 family)
VPARWAAAKFKRKEHEVMTGSIPSITLSQLSQNSTTTTATARISAMPAVRAPAQHTAVVVVVAAWAAHVWQASLHLRMINCVWRERRMLASLDDRALKDIGLNRGDVERECGRSVLDLPKRRRWDV